MTVQASSPDTCSLSQKYSTVSSVISESSVSCGPDICISLQYKHRALTPTKKYSRQSAAIQEIRSNQVIVLTLDGLTPHHAFNRTCPCHFYHHYFFVIGLTISLTIGLTIGFFIGLTVGLLDGLV